jgi:hypothetical protein
MNGELLRKSTKTAVVAASLSLVTASAAVAAPAQDAPMALGTQASLSLASYYANPPLGTTTLKGVTFTTGSAVVLGNGTQAAYALSYKNPNKVYLLLNSANTAFWYEGNTVGRVTLTFDSGATQSVDLVVGNNLREWAFGTDWTVDSLYDTANASNWWTGARADDPSIAAGLDMLAVPVSSANSSATLTGVTVANTDDWGSLEIRLAGLSVEYTPAATVSRPGNSCNTPALINSQAPGNASSTIYNPTGATQGTSTKSGTAGTNGAQNALRPCN